jgi:kynurenine 3-monooxygenase
MSTVTIVGAGLVGSLLGIVLAKRGHKVTIVERRADMRLGHGYQGRSINLALSIRGLQALEIAGVANEIRSICIPMHGRMMHSVAGEQTFQQYGLDGQCINSVSRGHLNKVLLQCAEDHGVSVLFNTRCLSVDPQTTTAQFAEVQGGVERIVELHSDVLFGADGAFSSVRDALMRRGRFNYSQEFIQHGYKELHIPATAAGQFQLERNALHIWPRKQFMMIALPNPDGSFTCTLFFAHQGEVSFEALATPADVATFFKQQFPDAVPLMPTLVEDFFANPESSLVTIRCSPWVQNTTALIGDAAHAIVPFYGQGMNCGFEDCRVLLSCLDATSSWQEALTLFEHYRKPAGDAIAQLALDNFIEMRDKVADPQFLLRKAIEGYLHQEFPHKHIPLYSMVTFSPDIPYNEALRVGTETDIFMAQLLAHPEIQTDWQSEHSLSIIRNMMESRPILEFAPSQPTT